MNKYLVTIIIIVVLVLGNVVAFRLANYYNKQWAIQTENVKAYEAENSALKNDNRVFKYTVNQLKYSKDSIVNKLYAVQKELKIKDKNIKQLQYILSKGSRVDTLLLKDTIFKNNIKIDTLIGDKWFSTKLYLEYPNKIIVSPEITLENYVMLYDKKEPINPPKKFFLWRWFQRKQIITEVKVIEKNKYVRDSISKFIIIRK